MTSKDIAGDAASAPATRDNDGSGTARRDATAGAAGGRANGGNEGNVGNALRSAYQRTVDETVPQEMLDLLGKLA